MPKRDWIIQLPAVPIPRITKDISFATIPGILSIIFCKNY